MIEHKLMFNYMLISINKRLETNKKNKFLLRDCFFNRASKLLTIIIMFISSIKFKASINLDTLYSSNSITNRCFTHPKFPI